MSKSLSGAKACLGWISVLIILLIPLLNLTGAVEMFLRLDNIPGESMGTNHVGEIDVLAWSWGASQSGTTHFGGSTSTAKASVQDISITKYLDKSSPDLLLKVMDGSRIANADLTVRNPVTGLNMLVINFTDIIVSSYSTGGSGGEDKLTENVSLNFAKFEFSYFEDDKLATEHSMSWSILETK